MTESELMLQAGEALRAAGQPVTPENVERYLKRVASAGLLAAQQRTEDFIARCRQGTRTAPTPRRPVTLQSAVAALNAAADKLPAPPAPTLAQEVQRELDRPEHKGKFIARVNEQSGDVQAFVLPVRYDEKKK
jgi:hypothetical protein